MLKYKFRLYPTKAQEKKLERRQRRHQALLCNEATGRQVSHAAEKAEWWFA
jgi:hypothetical protein